MLTPWPRCLRRSSSSDWAHSGFCSLSSPLEESARPTVSAAAAFAIHVPGYVSGDRPWEPPGACLLEDHCRKEGGSTSTCERTFENHWYHLFWTSGEGPSGGDEMRGAGV